MWNRSGLPLTLPLHVRTGPGKGYVLQLHDPETSAAVLAAYFEGGALFRVLAPPGEWRLVIRSGSVTDWVDEVSAFGTGTQTVFDGSVSFSATGFRTRQGVLIDLLGDRT